MNLPEMIYKLTIFFWSSFWGYVAFLLVIIVLKGSLSGMFGKIKVGFATFMDSYRRNLEKINSNGFTPPTPRKKDRDIIDNHE